MHANGPPIDKEIAHEYESLGEDTIPIINVPVMTLIDWLKIFVHQYIHKIHVILIVLSQVMKERVFLSSRMH